MSWAGTVEVLMVDSESTSGVDWGGGGDIGDDAVWGGRAVPVSGIPGWNELVLSPPVIRGNCQANEGQCWKEGANLGMEISIGLESPIGIRALIRILNSRKAIGDYISRTGWVRH